MTEPETTAQSLANYTKYFHKHLKDTRTHLYGSKRSSLLSSRLAPNGFWTSEEKERFFPALSRHSKLRPDLIALDVESEKTSADVIAYIEVLEQALKDVAGLELDGEEDVPFRHRPAHVVSEKWINFEEKQAARLATRQKGLEEETLELERKRASKLLRKELKSAATKEYDGSLSTYQDETQLRAQLEEALDSLEAQWAREDILEELATSDLVHMDKLIRRKEEATEERRRASSRERSVTSDLAMERDGSNDEGDLAPATTNADHKKLVKRLYMRRKRAEAAGVDYDPSEARLKPGRKLNATGSTRQEHLTADSQDDGEKQAGSSKPPEKKPNRRGLNVPQRTEKRFDDAQIDVEILHDDGLDLFHHSRFASLWSSLADEETTVQYISYTTLKLFRLLLERYVSKLLYMVISLAETESRSKQETVLWGGDYDSIRKHHVYTALDLLGVPSSHRTKAAALRRTTGSNSSEEDDSEGSAPPLDLSHPLIYYPQTLDRDNSLTDVVVMDEHEEKVRQLEEFADDANREVLDAANDARHELSLWRSMGYTNLTTESIKTENESFSSSDIEEEVDWSDEVGSEPVTNDPQGRRSLRFRPPGGDVKSQAFILSEDEEEYDMDLS